MDIKKRKCVLLPKFSTFFQGLNECMITCKWTLCVSVQVTMVFEEKINLSSGRPTCDCQKIKPNDLAHANQWFGGDPSTHGDQPFLFTTYYYEPFKSKGPKMQLYDMFSLAQW